MIVALGVALLVVWVVGQTLVGPAAVSGRSMQPALDPGDRLLIDRWTLRQRQPRAGEVILLIDGEGRPMVKRVTRPPHRVAGEIWVEGDNPAMSVDSRRIGAFPSAAVRGRVIFRYWPLGRIGRVGERLQRPDDLSGR